MFTLLKAVEYLFLHLLSLWSVFFFFLVFQYRRVLLGHGFFPLLHGVLAPGGQHGSRRRPHKEARGGDADQRLEASPHAWLIIPGGRQRGGLGAPLQTVTAQDTSAEPACTLERSALASPRAGDRVAAGDWKALRGPSLVLETEGRPPGLQGLASSET